MKQIINPRQKAARRWHYLLPCVVLLFVTSNIFAQNRLAITAQSPETSATSLYKFEFNCPVRLSGNGVIVVAFPVGFDLRGVTIAASSTILGGMNLKIKGQEVWVFRSGRGTDVLVGQKTDLFLSAVKNAHVAGAERVSLAVYGENKIALARFSQKIPSENASVKTLTGDVIVTATQ